MSETFDFFFRLSDQGGSAKAVSKDIADVESRLNRLSVAAQQADAKQRALSLAQQRDALSKTEAAARGEKDVGKRAELEKKAAGISASLRSAESKAELAEQKQKLDKLREQEKKSKPFASTAEGIQGALKPLSQFQEGLADIGEAALPLMIVADVAMRIGGAFVNAASSIVGFYGAALKAADLQDRVSENYRIMFGSGGQDLKARLDTVGRYAGINKEQRYDFGEQFAGLGVNNDTIQRLLLASGSLTANGGREKLGALGKIFSQSISSPYQTMGQGDVEGLGIPGLTFSKFSGIYSKLLGNTSPAQAARLVRGNMVTRASFAEVLKTFATELDQQAAGVLRGTAGGYGVERAGKTVETQLSILKDQFDTLLSGIERGPALHVLERLNALLDATSAGGKEFRQTMTEAFAWIDDYLKQYDGETGAKKLKADLMEVLSTAKDLASAFGTIANGVILIAEGAHKIKGGLDWAATKAAQWGPGTTSGSMLQAGIDPGVVGRNSLALQMWLDQGWDGTQIYNELKRQQDAMADGPPRPFAEGGLVTGPTHALIGEAGPELVIPLSQVSSGVLGGQTVTVTVPISVSIGHADKDTIDLITRELKTQLPTILIPIFDRLATQAGALN